MGAGDSPAGVGPAGFDPPLPLPPPTAFSPPQAALFDLATRMFPLMTDGSGRLREVHPIDQAVALGLGLVQGTIGSAPEIGAKFDRLRRASLKDLQKECEFMVEQALDRLI